MDSTDRMGFLPTRDLLHPKFESYKLSQPEPRLRRVQLPKPIDLTIQQNYCSFNLQEIKSQSTWNHLLVGNHQILWIEPSTLEISSFNIEIDVEKENPVSLLLKLPDRRQELLPYQLDHPIEFDYPSGLALNPSHVNFNLNHQSPWLFVDGGRRLFLVDLNPSSPQLLSEIEIDISTFIHGFYKIQSVQPHEEQQNTFWVILRAKSIQQTELDDPSSKTNANDSSSSSKKKKKNTLLYTVYLIQLRITPDPCFRTDSSLAYNLEIKSHLQLIGSHDLLSAHYDKSAHRWCLRSTSKFTTPTQATSTPEANQTIQPEVIGPNSNPDHLVSPYNWSQTLSSITIVFPIPSLVTSKSIKTNFQSNSIHFEITKPDHPSNDRDTTTLEDYLENLLNYFNRPGISSSEEEGVELSFDNDQFKFKLKVWDNLKVEDCTWYIESTPSNEEIRFFTLELEKINRLRWPQVFKLDDRVNETMDPSELLSITENLSKYTSNLNRSEEQKRQKRGLGVPDDESIQLTNPTSRYHSSKQEMMKDEEIIDSDNQLMVTGVVMTWLIEKKTNVLTNENQSEEWIIIAAQNGIPVELISNPLKLLSSDQDDDDLSDSIMIKSDVDGLVFKPPTTISSNKEEEDGKMMNLDWTHSITFPAISFILGSKTDICFSFFTYRFTLILESSKYNYLNELKQGDFNSSSCQDIEFNLGNVYVYYHPNKNQIHSNSQLIQLKSLILSSKTRAKSNQNANDNNILNSFKDDRIIGVCGASTSILSTSTTLFCLSKFNLFILDL